ncbi:MAG: AI-2E family transporter [Bacteroidota bacterium]|nr:AI-2E family transporter [Bacteroidota bacterium]
MEKSGQQIFNKRTVTATFIVLLMISGFLLIGYAVQFFFLMFGAILFAVLLRAGTNFLKSKIKISDGISLAITTLVFFGIFAGIIILIIPPVAEQAKDLQEKIPEAWTNLRENILQYEWGKSLLEGTQANGLISGEGNILNTASQFFTAILNGVSYFLILLVIGIFFAASPQLYQQGVVVMVAPKYRPKIQKVMDDLYFVLKSWLLGKFLTMLFVGIFSTLALIILNIPMAFALGFLAFLLDFIPTIGPIIAAIPAILAGFLVSPLTALLIGLIYFVLQSIESYVLVPYVYKKTVSISPVVTLASLVLFGILAGPIGIVLATPLVAVIQVVLKELYIKGYLENDLPEGSENSFESRMKKL